MKRVKRDINCYEFENFTFAQRLYYLWANELSIGFPDININPMHWCLMDVIKLIYVPILYLILAPTVGIISLFEAHNLKTRFSDREDKTWYKSDCWIIE